MPVLADLCGLAGDQTGVFMVLARDLSGISVGATLGVGSTGLTNLFQGMTFWVDVLIVVGIPFKVGAGPGAVRATGFVEARDVRRDLAGHEPVRKRPGAVGGVRNQTFETRIERFLLSPRHGLGRSALGLPD